MIGFSTSTRLIEVQLKSKTYMFNEQLEGLSRQELERLQLERLKSVVGLVAEKVPFYKERFAESGITADSIKSLPDLQKLPFTRKSDLRDNYPFGLFAVEKKELARIHASSGTKGKPTVVGYTKADIETWAEVCARSLAAAGAKPGDTIHNSYGYGLFTGGLGVHYGAEKLGATIVPASGGKTQQQVMLFQDFHPRVLCATPSYALNLALTMQEAGIDLESLNLEIGIFGAEPWTESMRGQIESLMGITALDIYGLSEIIGPGVSMECFEGKNGLHIWEDHFLPEIIDPESGDKLPYGEEGELVFTSLTRQAIPLIRYRTGDISVLHPEKCKCGRTMVRMNRVRARLDDMLIIRGVNLYPSEVEMVLLKIDELSPHYQLVIDRKGAMDTMEVQVEVGEEIVSRWGKFDNGRLEFKELTTKILQLLKETLGLSATVTLMPPKSIERSQGKAVRVVDRRSGS